MPYPLDRGARGDQRQRRALQRMSARKAIRVVIDAEVPTGAIDGVNAAYTLASTPVSGTLKVWVNGLLQKAGALNDYTLSGKTITFNAGAILGAGEALAASYAKA